MLEPAAPTPAKADKRARSAKAPAPKISPGFKPLIEARQKRFRAS
jgi:hypothetical protein